MNQVLWVATGAACTFALSACAPTASIQREPQSALLGTWAEIVTTSPANPTDGRQVIERFANGTFKLVFVKTHPAQPPCTGTWAVSGSAYRLAFTSASCFSSSSSKPEVGAELRMQLVESSPSRLRFYVPNGSPLAPWQAKLEGGIQ